MKYKIIIDLILSNEIMEKGIEAMDGKPIDHINLVREQMSFELPETSDYKVWLTEERKKEFEKVYNENIKDLLFETTQYRDMYYIVDSIKVERIIN